MPSFDRNSMFVWLPVVRQSGVPYPRTELFSISPADQRDLFSLLDGDIPAGDILNRIRTRAQAFGYPLFLRTDLASGKHNWENACYVPDADHLLSGLGGVIEANEIASVIGLPWIGLALREFLTLESSFRAFDNMPVARERRYFAQRGEVHCHHAYWTADAFERRAEYDGLMPADWRTLLADLNDESNDPPELALWASKVSRGLAGAWSVDFARKADGDWILIDMAAAEDSWHPEHGGGQA